MKFLLVYPSWPKLKFQTEFHLPPHGPVVMAAALPSWVSVTFADENVDAVPFGGSWDAVGISAMLTCQLPRAFAIAREFRARKVPVIFGGIAAMLHADEVKRHADSVFLGEAEGRLEQVFLDLRAGGFKREYNYLQNFPDIALVGPARRGILNHEKYAYKGTRMVDLFHASRGCRFNCFPCCTPFLGGRSFRPRPIDKVVEEAATIDNDGLFVVDNSLAQDKKWELDLFTAMIPFKKAKRRLSLAYRKATRVGSANSPAIDRLFFQTLAPYGLPQMFHQQGVLLYQICGCYDTYEFIVTHNWNSPEFVRSHQVGSFVDRKFLFGSYGRRCHYVFGFTYVWV